MLKPVHQENWNRMLRVTDGKTGLSPWYTHYHMTQENYPTDSDLVSFSCLLWDRKA